MGSADSAESSGAAAAPGRPVREATSVGASERSEGPPRASSAPSGGSAVREATSVGASERSEGPPRASSAPSGGSAVREATSVGAHIRWPAEAIWEAVAPRMPDFTVEVLPQLDSTNTELMRRAKAGRLEPVLLVAERQTAGRGRLGRDWHSGAAQTAKPAPDAGLAALTFSLGLPLAASDWSGLSLAVGVSVARSLHPDVQLKWPNDLWLADRKLGGILIETASFGSVRYAVIGVGVNLLPPDATGLRTPPAWLDELLPGIDAPQALLRLAAPLVQAVKRFELLGFAPFRADFNARDALLGRGVSLSDGTEGMAQGVDESGALLVHTSSGVKKITSSEVSVRPLNSPTP
jgi:BirA family biotin operon repressor/biotin-[acetyl-CoA-carboxylase] ligase